MPAQFISRASASPRTDPFVIVKSTSVPQSARRAVTRRKFSLAVERAALIRALKSAETNCFAVMADLYRATSPDDPVLENGNRLCKGKPVAYLSIWKSDKVGNEADPRTLALYSGPKLTAGSPDECGRYVYNASRR
jgi:hypothetical protein